MFVVYCPAGSYIVTTGANNDSHCEGCEKNTYKPLEKYYDDKCIKCPEDRPRTASVNSTAESDCRFGLCSFTHCFLSLWMKISSRVRAH